MRAEIAMNARTFDANKSAQVERCPIGIGGVAIGAAVVSRQLTKRLHFRLVAVLSFRQPLFLAQLGLQLININYLFSLPFHKYLQRLFDLLFDRRDPLVAFLRVRRRKLPSLLVARYDDEIVVFL